MRILSFVLNFPYTMEGAAIKKQRGKLFVYNYAWDELLNIWSFGEAGNYVKNIYYKVHTLPEMNQTPIFQWTVIIVLNCRRDIVGFNSYAVLINRHASWVLTCTNDISSTSSWDIPAGVSIALSLGSFPFFISKAIWWHLDFKCCSTCKSI